MRKRAGRKLLVASLGVGAVSYVANGCNSAVANLMAPPQDGSADTASGGAGGHGGAGGNGATDGRMDDASPDGATDSASDSGFDRFSLDLVANIVAPR